MNPGTTIGRALIAIGLVIVLIGAILLLIGRIPGLGRLPGDLVLRRGNVTVYVPLATMIIVSLVLTVVLNLLARLWRR